MKAPRGQKSGRGDRDLRVGELLHDLKTPANTLRLSASLLSREAARLPDGVRASAARAASAARELVSLAESLVDEVRGERCDEQRQRVELSTVCRRIIDDLRTGYPERPIHLEAPQPVIGRWVPKDVLRILQNLVVNALEHGRGGVEVAVLAEDGAGLLRVRNHGPPVPPAVRASLRAPDAGTHPVPGLGLQIIKRMAESYGGTVRCRSGAGKTVFEVRLPGADYTT